MPVLGLFGDGLGTVWGMVWGMVSLATRQTPLYNVVMPPRAGVLSSLWGIRRVAKLTIPHTVPDHPQTGPVQAQHGPG